MCLFLPAWPSCLDSGTGPWFAFYSRWTGIFVGSWNWTSKRNSAKSPYQRLRVALFIDGLELCCRIVQLEVKHAVGATLIYLTESLSLWVQCLLASQVRCVHQRCKVIRVQNIHVICGKLQLLMWEYDFEGLPQIGPPPCESAAIIKYAIDAQPVAGLSPKVLFLFRMCSGQFLKTHKPVHRLPKAMWGNCCLLQTISALEGSHQQFLGVACHVLVDEPPRP